MKKSTFTLIIILWLVVGLLSACTKPAADTFTAQGGVCWECVAEYKRTTVTVCQEDKPVIATDNAGNTFSVVNCKLK